MATAGYGDGRAGGRIVQVVERVVVDDGMGHKPEFRRDTRKSSCKLGATGSAINSRNE